MEQWRNDQPDITAKDRFHYLQAQLSERFKPVKLPAFQRRIKQWRSEIARKLVLGAGVETAECADVPVEQQE